MRHFTFSAGVIALATIVFCTSAAHAMIAVGRGNEPVADHNWPAGSVDLANQKVRIGWWEGPPFGGGEWHFLYRGDTAALQAAVDQFAKIKSPKLKIVVHAGPGQSGFLKDEQAAKSDISVDWEVTLWDAKTFNQLNNSPDNEFLSDSPTFRKELLGPRLDVYVSKKIDWPRVHVPKEITVSDERATSNGYVAADGNVVRGAVYDMVTSKPIDGATILIQKNVAQKNGKYQYETAAKANTNADGRFEIKKVPEGSYTVIAQAEGRAPRIIEYVTLTADTLKDYTTQLAPSASLSGAAVDSAGKALAGVKVHIAGLTAVDGRGYTLPEDPAVVTDAAGHFTLAGLPLGHGMIFAFADKLHQLDSLKRFAIPDDKIKLTLTATGAIHGRVLMPGNDAAKGTVVSVSAAGGAVRGSWGGSMNVNDDGTFQFDTVPPGVYHIMPGISFTPAGTKPLWTEITVKEGETTEVELRVK